MLRPVFDGKRKIVYIRNRLAKGSSHLRDIAKNSEWVVEIYDDYRE